MRSAPAYTRVRPWAGFALWVGVLVFAQVSAALAQETESRYQLAVTEFYQVQRETGAPSDSPTAQGARWHAVATAFQRIHRDAPAHPRGADSLFSAALALREAWLMTRRPEDANAALAAFRDFNAAYPAHRLAADSTMHQAALLEAQGDGAGAADLYRRIATQQPPGPQAPLAFARLNALLRQERLTAAAETPAQPAAGDPAPSVVKAAAPKGAPRLKRVQVLSALQFTRVILTTDRPVKPKVEQTVNGDAPGQLRLDFKRLVEDPGFSIPPFADDGLLKRIHVSGADRQSVRLAFDVAALERYELKTFELPVETKLVVDLYPRRLSTAAREDRPGAAPDKRHSASPVTARAPAPGGAKPARLPPVAETAPAAGDAERLSLKASLGLKIRTIMIDPGHGGHDPGATAFGVQEKDLALAIARRLRDRIRRHHPDVRVGMTREDDRFIALGRRPKLAKAFGADLFVSIHLNASSIERFHGVETYFLNLTSDASALEVAARENATSEKKVSDLNVILLDLLRDTNILESSKLAQALHTELVDHLKGKLPVRDLGVKQAPFMVLIGAEMPSVLVEAGFVTNRAESGRLKDAAYLDRIAAGIYAGLDRYISGEDIVQTAPRSWLLSTAKP